MRCHLIKWREIGGRVFTVLRLHLVHVLRRVRVLRLRLVRRDRRVEQGPRAASPDARPSALSLARGRVLAMRLLPVVTTHVSLALSSRRIAW